MPTINDLRQQAATIKNATQVGENTATRVGTTFETIADLLEGASVGQGVPSVDLSQLNALRTPADQTTANPTIYNVTTLHNLSSTTIKVGTLFIFSDGGRAVVTQILLSNYQVDGGGNISSPNTSQITMYYRMFNIVQETWSAWTLYAGGGGGGTIDPYPVSGSDNAVASNGVFERLQQAAPEVDINDIDDLDDYVNMQTGEASTYTIKAYHNLSSTWLRVGVLMVFANQANNTLTQICISNCMVDGGGNLIPNYTTNAMNVFYRFKQFSGNPPEGMTIGVWTTWAKFGDSGYQPDNEDIDLNASDQLQFANKLYDASAFSGLGRVYLRKNIVTSGGVDKNVLTQAMMNTANTIYHIQYDYDLNGQTITLPANVTLQFDGGSLVNGTIMGNHTKVSSENVCFKKSIEFSGSWDGIIYTKWLEFVSADDEYSEINGVVTRNPNPTDNTLVFKQLEAILNGSGGGKVVFEKGYYQTGIVDDTPNGGTKVIGGVTYPCWKTNVYVKPDWISLCLKDCKYVDIDLNGSTIKMLKLSCPMYELFCFVNCENASIHDGIFKGSADHFDYPDYVGYDEVTIRSNYELCYGIYQAGGYLDVHNMDVSYFQGDDIVVGSSPWYDQDTQAVINCQSQGFNIHDCEASYCGRNGITVHSSYNGVMNNVNIHNIGSDADNGEIGSDGIKGQNPRSGIDMEFEDGLGLVGKFVYNNLTIKNCNRRNFTCAQATQVESLSFNNLRSIGKPFLLSNMRGEVSVNNSYIESVNEYFISHYVTYNNTEILLTAGNNQLTGGVTFNNCYIHDNMADGYTGDPIFIDNYTATNPTAYFNGCKIELHKTIFKFHVCKNCDIDFYIHGAQQANGLRLYNCNVRGFLDDSSHSAAFYFGNASATKSNDMHFEGCAFTDILGLGGASSAGFYNDKAYLITLKDCTLKNCTQLPKNDGVIKNEGCTFDGCTMSVYASTGNKTNLYIDGCKITNTAILQAGYISVNNSYMEISGGTWPTFHNLHYTIRNSIIVDIGTNAPWAGPTGTLDADNSSIKFNKAYTAASANFALKNCVVTGSLSEASYAGTKENCVFSTPLPKSGATANRPTLTNGTNIGYQYFDTTLGKYVYWDGTQWIDGTGVPAANSLKVLSISQTDYDNLGTYDANTLYVITSV